MGFFNQIAVPVNSVLDQLFADPDLTQNITYKRFRKRDWDASEGANVTKFRNFPLISVRLRHTERSKLVSLSKIEVGDEIYLLRGKDVPSGMSLKDELVTEFGATQEIKDITDIFGLATAVTVDGVSE